VEGDPTREDAMFRKNKARIILRMVSAVTAGIFLFHQIVWSADIPSLVQPADDGPTAAMEPSTFLSSQSRSEMLVSSKNYIEDFNAQASSSPEFPETSHGVTYDRMVEGTDGWTSYYLGDLLKEKSHTDGRAYVYREHTSGGDERVYDYYGPGDVYSFTYTYLYDSEGTYEGRSLSYASGDLYRYDAKGKLIERKFSNGYSWVYEYYADGKYKVREYRNPNGSMNYRYSYFYSDNGEYLGYSVTYSAGNEYRYNAQNKLAKASYSSGYYYLYEYLPDGRTLSRIYYSPDDTAEMSDVYYYDEESNFAGRALTYADGRAIYYDADNRCYKRVNTNGTYYLYEYYPNARQKLSEYYSAEDIMIWGNYYLYDDTGTVYYGRILRYTSGMEYHYNADNKITKVVYSTGYYYIYEYMPDGRNKSRIYYKPDGKEEMSDIYHYDDEGNFTGRALTYADGREIYYDANNRCYKRVNANGTYYLYEYYPNGRQKLSEYYSAEDIMIWGNYYLYDDTGTVYYGRILKYADGREYHYDELNRMVKNVLSNGSFYLYTEFYPNRWYKTYEYHDVSGKFVNSFTRLYDPDNGYAYLGRVLRYADGREYTYDRRYRLTGRVYENGTSETWEFWSDTGNALKTNVKYDAEGDWSETIEYYEDGVTERSHAMADADPDESGDVVLITYDTEGRMLTRAYDEGTLESYDTGGMLIRVTLLDGSYRTYEDYYEGTIQARFVKEYDADDNLLEVTEYDEDGNVIEPFDEIVGGYGIRTDEDGSVSTYIFDDDGKPYKNTFLDAAGGVFWVYRWNEEWELNSVTKTYRDGTEEIYEALDTRGDHLSLIEKRIPEKAFMTGFNLPWINYGYDLGKLPGSDYHIGFSTTKDELYAQFDLWKGSYARVFLFGDLRSGVEFDDNGYPVSFTDKVHEDMRALLDAAAIFDIKLVPVLFDYTIADGVEKEDIYEVGEHPELITDMAKRQSLLGLFDAFFDEFAGHQSVYAWDIINEPEYAADVHINEMRSFVQDFVTLIQSKDTPALVTVGSRNRTDMMRYWTDSGLDLYQYHYYDHFGDDLSLDYPVNGLGLDKPVLAGEMESADSDEKIKTLYDAGYAGGFFWQDTGGFVIPEDSRDAIKTYFRGVTVTYEYYASGRKKHEIYDGLTVREFEDAAFYDDGNGRLISEANAGGDRSVTEYYEGTDTVKTVTFYDGDPGAVIAKKEYGADGEFRSVVLFDAAAAGAIRSRSNSDGTYILYDGSGNIREKAVMEDGDLITYDADSNMIRKRTEDGGIYVYDLAFGADPVRILRDDGSSREYLRDSSGALTGYYEYPADGWVEIYDAEGVLIDTINIDQRTEGQDQSSGVSITTEGGDVITYVDSKIVSVKFSESGDILTDIIFDEDGDLSSGVLRGKDGSVSVIHNGRLVRSLHSGGAGAIWSGNTRSAEYSELSGWTEFFYERGDDGEIISTRTFSAGAACFYDRDGMPLEFVKDTGEWTYYVSGRLRAVIGTDNIQRSYMYTDDADGKRSMLVSGVPGAADLPKTIVYSQTDGITPGSIILFDGTVIDHDHGRISSITGLSQRINVYGTGEMVFDNGKYRRFYDEQRNINKLIDENNTSICFDDGEISSVEAEDGSWVIYRGATISDLYDKKEGAHYETDPDTGRITKVTYDDGRVYIYSYRLGASGILEAAITNAGDDKDVTLRFYDGEYLVRQELPSGVILEYTYEADPDNEGKERIIELYQAKNGKELLCLVYRYAGTKTFVTDSNGTEREYAENGEILYLYTADGYVYKYTHTEQGTLIMELSRQEHSDGRIVYYANGEVDRVVSPDGTVLKDTVFDSSGKLESFTVILPSGRSRHVRVYQDEWTTITAPDGVKLIYKGNVLVAVNASSRLFMYDAAEKIPSVIPLDISDDLPALSYIEGVEGDLTEYEKHKLYHQYNISEKPIVEYITVNGNNTRWNPQTSSQHGAQAITSASCSGSTVVMNASITGGNTSYSKGEAFLDLRYPAQGVTGSSYYDLDGKSLSYYIKLEDNTLADGDKVDFRIFLKTDGWASQYSMPVTISSDGVWYKITLDVSGSAPEGGYQDSAFDPSRIRLVGIRAESFYSGMSYNGKIYVKDANHSMPPAGERVIDTPFLVNRSSVEPYVGVISEDQPLGGNPGYIGWDDIPAIYQGVEEGIDNGVIDLDKGSWRIQTFTGSLGVKEIERNDAENFWQLGLDLKAGDDSLNQGEMFIDLRYDVPDYEWTGPVNLTGKTMTFKVKAPEGFPISDDKPLWAQVFVKDINNNHQYGMNTLITAAGEWLEVTISPQFGEIEEGNSETSPDFDPTQCVHIGVKISFNEGAAGEYQGDFFVRNEINPDILNETTPVYRIDANALRDYAIDNNIVLTYEEHLGEQVRLAREALPSYFRDSGYTMATEYYPWGKVKSVLKGNSRIESYDTEGRLTSVTDAGGKELVKYRYSSEGDLVEVDYSGIRDEIKWSMQEARDKITAEAEKTIMEMAEAKKYAHAYVDSMIKPGLDALQNAENDLRRMWHEWDRKRFGWWQWGQKNEKKQAMRSIEDALRRVDAERRKLYSQAAELYAEIDNDLEAARADILEQLEINLENIRSEEIAALERTLEQEILEVTEIYYKKYLGRNITDGEKEMWLAEAAAMGCMDTEERAVFDVQLVIDMLEDDEAYIAEREENDNFINGVISGVEEALARVEEMSGNESAAFFGSSGISEEDVLYDARDFEAILKWLRSNNRHFGRSAFFALKEMLSLGSGMDIEDLAVKTILIDIFTGSITSITTGELAISLYALKTYASTQGLQYHAVQLDTSGVSALKHVTGDTGKAIIRVNGDHFIVVTGIDAETGKVTYYEPSQGASGRLREMNIDDLLSSWDGYALTDRGPPEDGISRVLTNTEAMEVRGSDPFLIFFIISVVSAVISTVLSFIDNEIARLLSNVFGIISLVTGVLYIAVNFGNIIKGFAEGVANIGKVLGQTTKEMSNVFIQSVTGFVNGLPALIGKAVIGISLNTAYTNALLTFGMNANIAGLTAAFISGGFVDFGTTYSATGSGFGLHNAFTSLVIEGTRYAGYTLGIDSSITNIIGIAAGTIVNAGLGGVLVPQTGADPVIKTGLAAISYVTGTTILPNVAGELAYYGITKLGQMIGLDQNISYLAGIGIRSSLRAGLGTFGQGGGSPGDWWDGLVEGLTQPSNLAIAFSLAGDALNLPPLVNNMIITAVMGAIDGFNENPQERITGMFQGMFQNFWNASVRALTFGLYDPVQGGWNKDWQKNYYLAHLIDFIDVVQEKGIVAAIENYMTHIFRDEAIRVINQQGGIADFITGNAEMVQEDGVWLKKINVTGNENLYLDPNTDNVIGRDYGDVKERGQYGINPITGGFGLINGSIEEITSEGTRMVYHVSGSVVIDKMEVYGTNGSHIQIIARDPETGLELNENGIPIGGIVMDFERGKLYEYQYTGDSINVEINFDDPNIDIQDIASFDFSDLSVEEKEDFLTYFFIMNGLNNPNPEGIPPDATINFREELANQGVNPNNVFLVPIYERGHYLTDLVIWLRDEFLRRDVIADELYQKYLDHLDTLTPEERIAAQKVSVLYSGSFNPWLRAVEKYDIDVETIVAYGGPSLRGTVLRKTIFDDSINNSHIKNFINIYGDDDHYGILVNEKKFSNVNVINIRLLGADHYDFSINPNKEGVAAEINEKAAQFNAFVTKRAYDINLLTRDLQGMLAVTPIYKDGKLVEYEVDLSKFNVGVDE